MKRPPDPQRRRNGTKTHHKGHREAGSPCPALHGPGGYGRSTGTPAAQLHKGTSGLIGTPVAAAAANVLRRHDPKAARSMAERAAGRTFQPVRRSSYDLHDKRAQVFRPIAGGRVGDALRWCDKLVQTAQEYDDTHKEYGARLGPVGDSGVRVLGVTSRFVRQTTISRT